MKFDDEAILCLGTVDPKSDCKPIRSIEHKSENGLENKDQNGSFYDMKSQEGKAYQFHYAVSDEDGWTTPNLDRSMSGDDSTHDEEEKLRDFVAPIPFDRSSLEIESFDKDSVFYVDKRVMEPELPELVVCYKENNYDVVKDICIDEGFLSKDKFLFDTDVDGRSFCTFLIDDKNCEKPQQKEIFSLGELLSMPEMGLEVSQPKSSDNSASQVNEQCQRPSENAIIAKPFSCEESENSNKQEQEFLASVAEELECGNEETISQTLGPDPGADLNSNVESKSTTHHKSETRNSSRPEDIGTESFSSQRQCTPGESSFSVADPPSGYSGPIAYSGSLSLRSDSSTTSTHSFAFPLLQTDWNSSPVRMAKAEPRRWRKHGNWRQVLCCRF